MRYICTPLPAPLEQLLVPVTFDFTLQSSSSFLQLSSAYKYCSAHLIACWFLGRVSFQELLTLASHLSTTIAVWCIGLCITSFIFCCVLVIFVNTVLMSYCIFTTSTYIGAIHELCSDIQTKSLCGSQVQLMSFPAYRKSYASEKSSAVDCCLLPLLLLPLFFLKCHLLPRSFLPSLLASDVSFVLLGNL